jgi:hypothetical protein
LSPMWASVHFNDQFPARSGEIGNIRTDGMLSAKVEPIFPQRAQVCPQLGLG